jgi:hypothetical protein
MECITMREVSKWGKLANRAPLVSQDAAAWAWAWPYTFRIRRWRLGLGLAQNTPQKSPKAVPKITQPLHRPKLITSTNWFDGAGTRAARGRLLYLFPYSTGSFRITANYELAIILVFYDLLT